MPTLAPVAVSDDFVYARSVEGLVHGEGLTILPSAATVVIQVLWGWLFAAVFGLSFGVLRISTLVLWAAGGLAVYGLCLELGASRARAALAAAVVVFDPLGYVLAFTYMTDGVFTALVAMAAYGYVRGLRTDSSRAVLAGSAAAALAFLVRQPGLLLPLGVLTWLVIDRRARDLRLVAGVATLPALAVAGYYAAAATGLVEVDSNSGDFLHAAGDAGVRGSLILVRGLSWVELAWAGFFVLPLAVAAAFALPRLLRRARWPAYAAVGVAAVVMAVGFAGLRIRDQGFPVAGQFVTRFGLGPFGDIRGGRLPLLSPTVTALLAWACAAAVLVAVLAVARRRIDTGAGVLLCLAAWQAAAVVLPSFIIRDNAFTYDRYLLPLLPLLVALMAWALRDVRLPAAPAWAVTGLLAVIAVAGTHDYLSYQSAAWRMAERAVRSGVDLGDLDGGAAWDGHHIFGRGGDPAVLHPPDPAVALDAPLLLSDHDVPAWWMVFYTPTTLDAVWVVSTEPLLAFDVVDRASYSSWLEDEPTAVYLLVRAAPPG